MKISPYTKSSLGTLTFAGLLFIASAFLYPPLVFAASPLMVPNYSVEQQETPTKPMQWLQSGYGTNTPSYEYVNEGFDGVKSVKVTVSDYISGDAKWRYAAQPIQGGEDYLFTAWYKTNTIPNVVAEYTKANGDTAYFGMPRPEPNTDAGQNWQKYSNEFSVPSDVVSVTVFFFLTGNGWVQTDSYEITPYEYEDFDRPLVSLTFDDGMEENLTTALPVMDALGLKSTQCYMSGSIEGMPDMLNQIDRVRQFLENGHEICSHTVSHPDLTTLSPAQLEYELVHSREYLESITNIPVPHFASPFGAYNAEVISAIKNVYSSHRSVDEGFNSKDNLDPYRLKVQNMTSRTTFSEFTEWVNKAKNENLWLILVYHKVTSGFVEEFDTPTEDFEQQMNWLATAGVTVKRFDESLAEVTAPDVIPPTLTFNASPLDIKEGSSTILTWTSTDTSTCLASNGWSGIQAVSGSVQLSPIATTTYTLTCSGPESSVESSVTVNVETKQVDIQAPVITLVGNSEVTLNLGQTYIEQGATALDNIDGDITSSIVIDSTTLNSNIVGTYMVSYRVVDATGNQAPLKTRLVSVLPRNLTITAENKTKVFGSADPELTYSITSGSLRSGDELDGELTRVAGEIVGLYTISVGTLIGGTNYVITFVPGTLEITPQVTPPSSGGGGGGGGGKKTPKKPTSTPVLPTTPGGSVLGTTTLVTAPIVSPVRSELFKNNFGEGTRSTEVIELQKILNKEGLFASYTTGYYGPLTKTALLKYQVKYGLPQSGTLDTQTRDHLNQRYGPFSYDISVLQALLKSLQEQLRALLATRKI